MDELLLSFIELAHELATDPPQTLELVCERLFTNKSTLSAMTKEHLGMGPMQYLREIRLKRANADLLKPADQSVTVESVMRKYHFTVRSRFAKQYRASFGEAPSQTLQRGHGQLELNLKRS